MTWLYRLFHYIVVPLILRMSSRFRVVGQEHVPRAGAVIVVSNHVDNWDTYVIGGLVRGRVIHYLARADGINSRWLGWYWRQLGALPADREGLAEALKILRGGGAIGVFPEGVIAPAMVQAIPGSAVLALRSGATVVPAAVWGTERIRPLSFLRRPRVIVRFGAPRRLRRARSQDSQDVADELMREIAGMLPPRYRGHYGAVD